MAAHERYSKVGPYILMDTLGVGSFGKVKLAVHSTTYERYACKILDKNLVRERVLSVQVQKEIEVMQRLSHRNIVSLVNVYSTTAKVFIIMELVTGGELFEEILRHKRLDEPYARFYFRQLIDGVQHCHEKGVYHRDLKPENLLLGENKTLKITDFGLSTLKAGGQSTTESVTGSLTLHTQCGTPNYVAPEIITLDAEGYKGPKVDAWACGVILYVLVAGALPFDAPEMDVLFRLILRGRLTYPPYFSPSLVDLISNMLKTEPSERYSLADVKNHPWFHGPVADSMDEEHRSPVPSPLPSNTAPTSSSQSPRSVSTENAHEDVSMSTNKVHGPSLLSQYELQPPHDQQAQPPVIMRTHDSLDIGIRAESAESNLVLSPSFPGQQHVSTSPVLPAAISDHRPNDGNYEYGNAGAHILRDSFDDPVLPMPADAHPNPLDRFRSRVLGDNSGSYVPSSDDDNEFEEAQEVRGPPGLYGPRGRQVKNGTVSPVRPPMRRARSLGSLSTCSPPMGDDLSNDTNDVHDEYNITYRGIRGRVKRHLWDRAAETWRIPAHSFHTGNFDAAAAALNHPDARGRYAMLHQLNTDHTEDSEKITSRTKVRDRAERDGGLSDQGIEPSDAHKVSPKEDSKFQIVKKKPYDGAARVPANGTQLSTTRTLEDVTAHGAKNALQAAVNSASNLPKSKSMLVRSQSHDGRFPLVVTRRRPRSRTTATSRATQTTSTTDRVRIQRSESTQQNTARYQRSRKKRKSAMRNTGVQEQLPPRYRPAVVRFQDLQREEKDETQFAYCPDGDWVQDDASKRVWCKMMKDYDMTPDSEEFGMNSHSLNELWREGLAKEKLLRTDSFAAKRFGQAVCKLSRSSQYLSSLAYQSSGNEKSSSRRVAPKSIIRQPNGHAKASSPSSLHGSRSSSPNSGKEEGDRLETGNAQVDDRQPMTGGAAVTVEKKPVTVETRGRPPELLNPPVSAFPLSTISRTSPSGAAVLKEQEAINRAGRRSGRQISFAQQESSVGDRPKIPAKALEASTLRTSLDRGISREGRTDTAPAVITTLKKHETDVAPVELGDERVEPTVGGDESALLVQVRSSEGVSIGPVPGIRAGHNVSPGDAGGEAPVVREELSSAVHMRLAHRGGTETTSEGSGTLSSSSVPTKRDGRSRTDKRQGKPIDTLSDTRSSDLRHTFSDRATRSSPVDSMSSGAMASGGSDGIMSIPGDGDKALNHTQGGEGGFGRVVSGMTFREDEDNIEPSGNANVSAPSLSSGLDETRTTRSASTGSRPPPKPTLRRKYEEKVVSPFSLDIPGPKGKVPPSGRPWNGLISSGNNARPLQRKPFRPFSVKSYTQFHTLLEPQQCFTVMHELLRQYGCPQVKGIVVKPGEKFKIKCATNKEGRSVCATLHIYKQDSSLSVVLFKRKGKSDFEQYTAFYADLYNMYCEKAKSGQDAMGQNGSWRSRRRRTRRHGDAHVHFGEISSSAEEQTGTITSVRSGHESTLPTESTGS